MDHCTSLSHLMWNLGFYLLPATFLGTVGQGFPGSSLGETYEGLPTIWTSSGLRSSLAMSVEARVGGLLSTPPSYNPRHPSTWFLTPTNHAMNSLLQDSKAFRGFCCPLKQAIECYLGLPNRALLGIQESHPPKTLVLLSNISLDHFLESSPSCSQLNKSLEIWPSCYFPALKSPAPPEEMGPAFITFAKFVKN